MMIRISKEDLPAEIKDLEVFIFPDREYFSEVDIFGDGKNVHTIRQLQPFISSFNMYPISQSPYFIGIDIIQEKGIYKGIDFKFKVRT